VPRLSEEVREEVEPPCLHLPGESTFLDRHLYGRPELADRADLFRRYFEAEAERDDLAELEGLEVGWLLRHLNDTAPLSEPLPYRFRGVEYRVRVMLGLCDDYQGDRFGKFGQPFTLRIYLTEDCGLPATMFEIADFNFMSAGLPYYAGYVYGSMQDATCFVSGIQSDIAQRYAYLFLGGRGPTWVREGDRRPIRDAADVAERFRLHVPALRRTFQRWWVDALLAGIATWARAVGLTAVAIHQFELDEAEASDRSNVVHRIYRHLPTKLAGTRLLVTTECSAYRYHVVALEELLRHLGPRYQVGAP